MTATIRAYNRLHNLRNAPFSYNAVKNLVVRFDETGSVMDRSISGRRSLVEDREENVKEVLDNQQRSSALGATSTRRISEEADLPQSTVW